MKTTEEVKDGFWINPKTFHKKKVQKKTPDGVIIVTSTKVTLDDGRTVFDKDFYIAQPKEPQKVSKKEASRVLISQMQEYMVSEKKWPPNTSIKEVQKNRKVKLSFNPDPHVEFNLIFNPEIEGVQTEQFLKSLSAVDKPRLVWRVEPAKSSRALCGGCELAIEKGTLRIGKPSLFQDHLTYKWYHLNCAKKRKFILDPVEGLENISKDEKRDLKASGLLAS